MIIESRTNLKYILISNLFYFSYSETGKTIFKIRGLYCFSTSETRIEAWLLKHFGSTRNPKVSWTSMSKWGVLPLTHFPQSFRCTLPLPFKWISFGNDHMEIGIFRIFHQFWNILLTLLVGLTARNIPHCPDAFGRALLPKVLGF